MRIQEMRSGFSHLKRRVEEEERRHEKFKLHLVVPKLEADWSAPASELDEHRWSLVSADALEASEQTYRDANELMHLLEAHGIAGLCVISDEAATRQHA